MPASLRLILRRRQSRALLEAAAEVLRVGESAGVSHFCNGLVRMAQQLAGAFDASLMKQVLWRNAHGLLHFSLQTTATDGSR